MREHETCEEAIFAAMAAGKHGMAEYLAARCDHAHPTPDTPTDQAPRAHEAQEQASA